MRCVVGQDFLGGVLQAVEEVVQEGRRFRRHADHAFGGADDLPHDRFVELDRRIGRAFHHPAGFRIRHDVAGVRPVHGDVADGFEVLRQRLLLAREGFHAPQARLAGGIRRAEDEGAVGPKREAGQLRTPRRFRRAAQHHVAIRFPPRQVALVAIAQQHDVLPLRNDERAEVGEGTEIDDPPVAVRLPHQGGAELHEIGTDLVGADDVEAAAGIGEQVAPLEFLIQPRHRHARGDGKPPLFVRNEFEDAAVGNLLGHEQGAVRGKRDRPRIVKDRLHPLFQRNLRGNGPARQGVRNRPAFRERRFRLAVLDHQDAAGALFRHVDVAIGGIDRRAPRFPQPVGQGAHRQGLGRRLRGARPSERRRRHPPRWQTVPHGRDPSARNSRKRLLRAA